MAYTENHYGKAEEPAHKRKLKNFSIHKYG
jgi:hypothetical protein